MDWHWFFQISRLDSYLATPNYPNYWILSVLTNFPQDVIWVEIEAQVGLKIFPYFQAQICFQLPQITINTEFCIFWTISLESFNVNLFSCWNFSPITDWNYILNFKGHICSTKWSHITLNTEFRSISSIQVRNELLLKFQHVVLELELVWRNFWRTSGEELVFFFLKIQESRNRFFWCFGPFSRRRSHILFKCELRYKYNVEEEFVRVN